MNRQYTALALVYPESGVSAPWSMTFWADNYDQARLLAETSLWTFTEPEWFVTDFTVAETSPF